MRASVVRVGVANWARALTAMVFTAVVLVWASPGALATPTGLGAPSAYAYNSPVHLYDAVVHSVQARAGEVAPSSLSGASEGAQQAVLSGAGPLSVLSRLSVAADSVAVNGETAATALGRQTHAAWDYGPGYEPEFTLPSGSRVDAINFETRTVIELKPNNPRAIRLGEQQVARYVDELNQTRPGDVPWTGSVVTYGAG